MGAHSGANVSMDGLVFSWDSANKKSTKAIGTNYTGNQIYSDVISGSSLTGSSNLYVGGKTYYTLYGLQYPESSQSPASRQGVTPGINNTTATKLYDASRDVNYYVFDEDTNSWISDSYFNGERTNGHCYDTYDGAPAQHATLQADFDNISATFPNATHIVIGSHASDNVDNDPETFKRLQTIGMPDDHLGLGRVEFVLVGKVGRPSTWHYTRENVNSGAAMMNVGLPLEPKELDTGLTFNGASSSYISTSNPLNSTQPYSVLMWVKPDAGSLVNTGTGSSPRRTPIKGDGHWNPGIWVTQSYIRSHADTQYRDNQIDWSDNRWSLIGQVFDGTNCYNIFDGELLTSSYSSTSYAPGEPSTILIGGESSTSSYNWDGQIGQVLMYQKALTANEVKQHLNATRGRYL